MTDALIIGGGAIGLASAWSLAQRGLEVTVLERDSAGEHAASRAAAGMLSAQLETHPSEAMAELCLQGRERHKTFLPELAEATGVDLDYRVLGALRVAWTEVDAGKLRALIEEQRRRGWNAELLAPREAYHLEPTLGPCHCAGYFEGESVVDPRRLIVALTEACKAHGVTLRTGVEVTEVQHRNGRAEGVLMTNGERLTAEHVVIAGGAWSASIHGTGLTGAGLAGTAPSAIVRPIRGQMLQLRHACPPAHLIDGPGAYLSPRSDGRVLVGSTLEDVGFQRGVTPEATESLLQAAIRLVPHLADATIVERWCGFRPTTRDRMPLLGLTPTGALVATGHHRNGILLAAVTADIVTAIITGEASPIELAPFAPAREMRPADR